MVHKFIIDRKLPGLNEYTKANRSNAHIGAKMKKEVEEQIFYDIKQQLKSLKIINKVKIHFIWYEKNEKRDLDNICFAKKFILDALVMSGVIKNDTVNEVIGFTDFFEYGKENKVVVELEEI